MVLADARLYFFYRDEGTFGCFPVLKNKNLDEGTGVAEMITELIRFEAEVCICNGHGLKFKGESVSAVRDFC